MHSSSAERFPPESMKMVKKTNRGRSRPVFEEPQEVGSFSLSGPNLDNYRRKFHDDRMGLRALHRRGPGTGKTVRGLSLDLNQGLNSFLNRDKFKPLDPQQGEHLDQLLTWILYHKQDFLALRPKLDMIVWPRGALTQLMCSPYEQSDSNEGWILCVSLIDGLMYMALFESEDAQYRRLKATPKDNTFSYWGYKFEQIMVNDPTDKEGLSKPVNNYEAFISVLYARIGHLRVLFGAEVDCVDLKRKQSEKPPKCYVELKQTKILDEDRRQNNIYLNRKLMKWWAQSFIAGVPNILVGYRDDQGKVLSTDEIETKTLEIPKPIEKNRDMWAPAICMNFLDDFCSYLRRVVKLDYTRAVYKFEWKASWDHINASVHAADSQYRFVPDWYLDERPK